MQYPSSVQIIIDRLYANGESAYIVGGSVRDMLLGGTPHDFDITTSSLPQRTAEIFSDMRLISTGLKHGTLTVICQGEAIEITTFRIDGIYTDSRHPDRVEFTRDIALDLSRRDFTVNAMAYNKSEGLLDLFGGENDLRARIIRAVGDADTRFEEDALRILRAFRFCAQLDFDIAPDTLEGARRKAHKLEFVARERIANEFLRLICSSAAPRALHLMRQTGVLKYVIGEQLPDSALFDVICKMPPEPCARLSVLLCGFEREHAAQILTSLRASSKLKTSTLAIAVGCKSAVAAPADARRLIANCGIYAPHAAMLGEILGISPDGAYQITLHEQSKPHSLAELKINGKDIATLGVRGKQIGSILKRILAAVIEQPELNERDTLLSLAEQFINEDR